MDHVLTFYVKLMVFFPFAGSRFYENELKKDKITSKKIAALREQLNAATEAQLTACRNKVCTDMSKQKQKHVWHVASYCTLHYSKSFRHS